jgi:predicted permease
MSSSSAKLIWVCGFHAIFSALCALFGLGDFTGFVWVVVQRSLYVFVPLVVFKGALLSDTASFLLYIALSFGISLAMGLLAGCYRKWFGAQLNVGVLRCTFSYFNIGWFGIPIVYALYGEAAAIVMTGLYVGGMLFGNTVGFLWVTDGHGSGGVLKKLSKIPALYAMALGVALHFSPILPVLSTQAWLMQGLAFGTVATSVLGMGLVGMSVADVSHRAVAWLAFIDGCGFGWACRIGCALFWVVAAACR